MNNKKKKNVYQAGGSSASDMGPSKLYRQLNSRIL